MAFENLKLNQGILKALKDAGFTEPTPIQLQVIPEIMNGRDIQGSAQTGTGKTAAFLLPALNMLTEPSPIKAYGPRVLILVPTRELAMQVAAEAVKYSRYLSRVKTVCIYGGAPYPVQNRELSRPYEILVATPGRLIDHMQQGRINFARLEMFILDEADRMLDMGFIDPVEQIAAAIPKTRQTLLFSATLKGSVLTLSRRLLRNPLEVSVSPEHAKHENIEQRLHLVDDIGHKRRLLEHFLNDSSINQVIVFTATKRHADSLAESLIEMGYEAGALHGDMNQGQRTRTINKLRQGAIRILIATDVAARGIDVLTVSHVVNFDLPNNPEDYVHRIGRTGRAGAKGLALSFAAPRDMHLVRQIEQFTGQKMNSHIVAGLEPRIKNFAPSSKPGGGYSRPGGGYSKPKRPFYKRRGGSGL